MDGLPRRILRTCRKQCQWRAIDTLVASRVASPGDAAPRPSPLRGAPTREAHLSGSFFRLLTTAAAAVPDRAVPTVARALAPAHYALWPRRREALTQNLSAVTGEPAGRLRERALDVCASYNAYLLEFLRLARLTSEDILARTVIEGDDIVPPALATGRGIVACSSHVGNWEWFAAWCAARSGRPLATVAGVQLSPGLHAHVRAMKRRHNVDIVQPQDGYRTLYRRLARREMIGLAVDGDVFRTGREATLFGRRTSLGDGAARLAHRTGSLLLYGSMVRVGALRFVVRCEPPIGGWEPERRTVQELDDELRAAQERHIRRHLDQWCVFRPLWTGPPEPAPLRRPDPSGAQAVGMRRAS